MSRSLHLLRESEAMRDFHKGSIRQINHLIQFGPQNLALTEARCEIYKVSVSFEFKRKLLSIFSNENHDLLTVTIPSELTPHDTA